MEAFFIKKVMMLTTRQKSQRATGRNKTRGEHV